MLRWGGFQVLAGNGIMVNWGNWNSQSPEDQRAWRKWHEHHMVGRLEVPGFIRGRRYGAVEADRNKMTFYEMDSPAVLATEAYKKKVDEPFNQPGGSLKDTAAVRNIAAVKHTLGAAKGVGGFALTLRLNVLPENEARFTAHLVKTALPAIAELGDITGAHLCVSDAEASSIIPNSLKAHMIVGPRWIVMIEGMTRNAVRAAFDAHLSSLERHGCEGPIEPNIYQLEVVMTV
jgi:hypothetical protein